MNASPDDARALRLAPAITIGWATSVGMWLVGFLLHLPGLNLPAMALGIIFLAIHLGSGLCAALLLPREGLGKAALIAGAITGLINLLVVGAVVVNPDEPGSLQDGALLAILGYPVISALACFTGAAFASRVCKLGRLPGAPASSAAWLAIFATVTIAAAVPVLISGGLVTSHEAGLAVPDWPTSYGANMFLYPLSKMTGGIYYEHAHRLFASLVGLTTIALLVFTLRVETRGRVKLLALLALVFVIAQGVVGGMRVTSADEAPNPDAIEQTVDNAQSVGFLLFHAISAQLFFAYLCVLAGVLSTTWRTIDSGDLTPAGERNDPRLRRAATIALALLVLQLFLGSVTRHLQSDHAAYTHAGLAFVVLITIVFAGARAIGAHKDEPTLKKLGHAVIHTTGLQVALGLVAFFLVLPYDDPKPDTNLAILFATAHHFVGAMLLGAAALLCAWSYRYRATDLSSGQ